jgi:hypothetical protein
LTNQDKTGMGRLFKVLGLAHPELGTLPGLEEDVIPAVHTRAPVQEG